MKKYMLTIATATLVLMSGILVVVTTLPSADAAGGDGAGCASPKSERRTGCVATQINPSNEGGSNELLS